METKRAFSKVMLAESAAIADVAQKLDIRQTEEVYRQICSCKGIVYFTGCGTSGAAGKKICHTLCCVKRPSVFLEPADALHGGLGAVGEKDVVVLLSKGGQTEELLSMMPSLKKTGCTTIAVTDFEDAPLAKQAGLLLQLRVSREPDPFGMLATASILAVISFFDSICIAYMEETAFSKEQFEAIHPEGAVGKQLKEAREGR